MKKAALIILCLWVAALSFAAKEEETFESILKKMEKAGDYTTTQAEAVMKIIDREGNLTEMGLTSYEKKGTDEAEEDRSLMRFTSPARLKGTAILVVGNSIWYYNNRTNRVRLLSQSAKKGSMMGSGFSYEDLEVQYSKDFTGEVTAEDRKHYTLKLFPKEEKNYAYMLVKTRKEDYLVDEVEYYNTEDLMYKYLISKDFKKVSGRVMPMLMEMKEVEDGKITRFEMDENSVKYDIELEDKMFSERNLRK